MYVSSITPCNTKVSSISVLLTIEFHFQDCQARSIYLLSLPSKNTSSPPFEPLYFKFANVASLKQIKAAFDMSSILEMTKQHLYISTF